MDYNDFREFFKVHVKEYGPYRDSKMFQVFSNFLMDSYFNDSYTNIPAPFKEAFETQIIPSEFVVPLLQSLGIPDADIDKIPNSDRFKIINSLSDFHRYKGTVALVDKLVSNFDTSDNIAVYELYLDMHINANGGKVWDVIPKLISAGAGFQRSLELTSTELFTLLDQAPNWFIDEITLGTLYDSGEMILPYKTNCVLLDSTILNNLEPITQIVSELVVETFKDSKIQLFLKDGVYVTTFGNVNILWYYTFQKLYLKGNNVTTSSRGHIFSGSGIFSRYVIPNVDGTLSRGGSNNLNSSLTNIQTMIDEYSKLSIFGSTSGIEISNFYETYIDIFNMSGFSRSQTFTQYRASVISAVGIELVNYIDIRLDSAINSKNESGLLGAEIYSSLLTFKSLNNTSFDSGYLDYYYLNLPGLVKDIKNSTTYVMLNFLKPYHSDLIDRQNQKIICNSKFDNALVSYSKVFSTIFFMKDVSTIMDSNTSLSTSIWKDTISALEVVNFNVIYTLLNNPDTVKPSHITLFQSIMNSISHTPISEDVSKLITSAIESQNLQLLDSLNAANAIYISMSGAEILVDNVISKLGTSNINPVQISDSINRLLYILIATEGMSINDKIKAFSSRFLGERDLEIATDTSNTISSAAGVSLNSTSDVSVPFTTIPNYENLPVSDVVTSFTYDNPLTGSHIVYTN